jgi:cytochrome c oxidase subunit I+III
MYPPLTTAQQTGVGADIWLLGLTFIEIASIAAAVELIVGVLRCRPPGMRINLIPLYAWYMLVVGAMIIFAFPPLIAGDILLELERLLGWPFFDPTRGGDPLLWQHLFWIFGHPEVYIVFLPSIAIIAMIVPTFAGRPIVGYSWVVLSAVGTGFLSFGLWVHHMFTTGLPGISLGFFSAASQAVAIPTGIQIFCFIATLLVGRVTTSVAMLYAFGGLATFILGGLTGVMLAAVPFDFQAHDTYFVVSHLHYVMVGGVVFPIVAGIHYFYPLVRGHRLSDGLGRLAFWIMFIGFNVTFLPMHLTGLLGMPRRIFTYPADVSWETLNMVSSAGAFVLAAGFLPLIWDLIRPRRERVEHERNPWNAGTLEWTGELPGRPWGIRSIPEIDSRYPLWDQPEFVADVDEGRFYLPDAQELQRETLVTSTIDADPIYCLRLAQPSWLPFVAAMFTGGFFILSTFHVWWAAVGSAVLAVVVIFAWLWTGTSLVPEKPAKDVGMGLTLPLYRSGPDSVGWWGMSVTMIGDLTAFAGLVFGYFFYWTVHEDFPPPGIDGPGVQWPVLAGALVGSAWLLTCAGRSFNRRTDSRPFYAAFAAAAVLGGAGGAGLLAGPWLHRMDPTSHVYPAIVWVLVAWTTLHVVAGLLMQLYCIARRAAGRLSPEWDSDVANVTLYWHFVAVTVLVTVGVIAGFPLVA